MKGIRLMTFPSPISGSYLIISSTSPFSYLTSLLLSILLFIPHVSCQIPLWSSGSSGSYYNQFSEYRPQNVINSLLTPMTALTRTECFTSGNRAGICMSKKSCGATGGIAAGSCGVLGSCCIYQGSCRSVINANESYFVSPSFPNSQADRLDPPICIFTLQRDNFFQKWPVCQIRIDFDEFTLAPPFNGTCGGVTDSFVISGASNFNTSGLPETGICGDMSGQHLYFNVNPDDVYTPLLLVINAANDRMFNRKWSIRIRQIPCRSPSKAPPGCLQYFTESQGVIESFNFRGFNKINNIQAVSPSGAIIPPGGLGDGSFHRPFSPGGFANQQGPPLGFQDQVILQNFPNPKYMSGLNYGVCIAQQPLVCGIRWEVRKNGKREKMSNYDSYFWVMCLMNCSCPLINNCPVIMSVVSWQCD